MARSSRPFEPAAEQDDPGASRQLVDAGLGQRPASRRKVDQRPASAVEAVDGGGGHIGAHHHAGAAARRRVVDRAVLAEAEIRISTVSSDHSPLSIAAPTIETPSTPGKASGNRVRQAARKVMASS